MNLNKYLSDYIKTTPLPTQDQCIGFVDGFNTAYKAHKNIELNKSFVYYKNPNRPWTGENSLNGYNIVTTSKKGLKDGDCNFYDVYFDSPKASMASSIVINKMWDLSFRVNLVYKPKTILFWIKKLINRIKTN